MITTEDIPRDGNGIMQGAWRLLHRDPEFHGNLVVDFVKGEAQAPVSGRRLLGLVAVFGHDLFIEPWGPLPEGFSLPPLVEADVPEEMRSHLERCPWREPVADAPASTEEQADELEAMSVEDLRALAEQRGLKLAKNIGKPKALIALRAQAAETVATAEATETQTTEPVADAPASTEEQA